MEHLESAVKLVERNCFLASIDLKDVYYSVSIHKSCRKYLNFLWNSRLYQFTCLAQVLSCAPRVFTKLMKHIYAQLTLLTYHHAEAAATYPLLFFQQLLQKA